MTFQPSENEMRLTSRPNIGRACWDTSVQAANLLAAGCLIGREPGAWPVLAEELCQHEGAASSSGPLPARHSTGVPDCHA